MLRILCFTVPFASSVDLYVTKPAKPAPTPKSTTKVEWHVDTIATATILFELILALAGWVPCQNQIEFLLQS